MKGERLENFWNTEGKETGREETKRSRRRLEGIGESQGMTGCTSCVCPCSSCQATQHIFCPSEEENKCNSPFSPDFPIPLYMHQCSVKQPFVRTVPSFSVNGFAPGCIQVCRFLRVGIQPAVCGFTASRISPRKETAYL